MCYCLGVCCTSRGALSYHEWLQSVERHLTLLRAEEAEQEREEEEEEGRW